MPRRVYVDFDGINLRRKFLTGLDPDSINMTIGMIFVVVLSHVILYSVIDYIRGSNVTAATCNLLFLCLAGSLQIQKLGVLSELSSNGRMLYPVGYQ